MADAPKAPSPDLGGRIFSIGMGALMLLVAALLTWGAFFERRPPGESFALPAQGYLLLVVVWMLALNLLLSVSRRAAFQRAGSLAGSAALACFVVFAVVLASRAACADPASGPRRFGATTLAVLVVFAAAAGAFLMGSALLQQRRARAKGEPPPALAPAAALAWPLLAFVKAPVGALVVGTCLTAVTALGEWLGGKWGHPIVGAALGLVLPLGLAVLLGGVFASERVRGRR